LVGNAIFDRYWTVAYHADDTNVCLQLIYNTIHQQPGPGFWQPSSAITMKLEAIFVPQLELRRGWPCQAVLFGLQTS
jgi:hypothetical protein